MRFKALCLGLMLLLCHAASLTAGDGYQITSTDGKTTKTYNVVFGGGRANETATAFDPASKEFVYLHWPRGTPMPQPAGSIWLAATGETILLYKFPKVESPLPIIKSIEDLKVCPYTGDTKLKSQLVLAVD